jgi:hypothetical protein
VQRTRQQFLSGPRLAQKQHGTPTWSPNGRYTLAFNGKDWESISIPDGKTGDFKVTFPPEVRPDTIGLLILLIGPDNYGAFVPPAAG